MHRGVSDDLFPSLLTLGGWGRGLVSASINLCIVVVFVLVGYSGAAVSQPRWEILRTRVWPQVVGLGEPFHCQVIVRVPPGIQFSSTLPTFWGSALLVQPPKVQSIPSEPNTMRLDFVLALYTVQTFGPQTLPALGISVETPEGQPQEVVLPGIQIEIIPRYAGVKKFHQAGDPVFPVSSSSPPQPSVVPSLPRFSHEWRFVSLKPSSSSQSSPWLSPLWMVSLFGVLLCFLLGTGYWWRQRKRWTGGDIQAYPHEIALQTLSKWHAPTSSSAPEWQRFYQQGLQILRIYLAQRLESQLSHLTERELFHNLHSVLPVSLNIPDAWWNQLQHFLQQCEQSCYHPYPPTSFAAALATELRTLLNSFESQVARWEKQRSEAQGGPR